MIWLSYDKVRSSIDIDFSEWRNAQCSCANIYLNFYFTEQNQGMVIRRRLHAQEEFLERCVKIMLSSWQDIVTCFVTCRSVC